MNKKNEVQADYVTRETLLKLLSDHEVASVSTAETAAYLADGDEYVDLEKPDRGVLKALGKSTAPMGHVLSKKAVQDKTWRKIVALVSEHHAVAEHSAANKAL